MIRPPGIDGVAFSEARDGDQRSDSEARTRFSAELEISPAWATVEQIHGREVRQATQAGSTGRADALWTAVPGLPIAVFTADCFGVVLRSLSGVGVAHAGWRGADVRVVTALRQAMVDAGHVPSVAVIGPGIGPCCFEVGEEVAVRFENHLAVTTWGTRSVNLRASLGSELSDLEVVHAGGCTHHERNLFSHRRDRTPSRLAAVGWLP